MHDDSPLPQPIEIPISKLDPDVLSAVIESFILREGTDYGSVEVSLDKKIAQVRKQLERDDVKIIFEPGSETVTLITKKEWQKLRGRV